MKRKRYSVEQIVAVVRQHDLGVSVADIARKLGIAEQTFYRRKKQYGGLEASEVQELKKLREEIAKKRGAPKRIYCDYGSEFVGRLVDLWAYANGVVMEFSRPGKPTDNAFIESFNGSLRDECLNVHWFDDLTDATEKLQAWRREYNETRPHRSLDEFSPLEFKARWAVQRPGIS